MKYVISVMLVILFISVPLSFIGFTVAPTFTSTLANMGNALDWSDNFFIKILGDFIAKEGFDTSNLQGDLYVFDPDIDALLVSSNDIFKDVHYLIRFKPNVKDGNGMFYGIFTTNTGHAINDLYDKSIKPDGYKFAIAEVGSIPPTYLAFNQEGEFLRVIFPAKSRDSEALFAFVEYPASLSNSFYSDFISSCAVQVSYKIDPLIGKPKTEYYDYQVSAKYKGNLKDFYNYYLIGGGSF